MGASAATGGDRPGRYRSSRFALAAHDARLLLLRLAHKEPLHAECGGGGRSSNLSLCVSLLQLAGHGLTPKGDGGAADGDGEGRYVASVVDAFAAAGAAGGGDAHKIAEAAPHVALLTLFVSEAPAARAERWASLKAKLAGYALRRAVDRARSRAAAKAAVASAKRDDDAPAAPEAADDPAALDAPTATRARTYARAALSYLALVDKMHGAVAPRGAGADGAVPLQSGDDAAIAAAAAGLTAFYDASLKDAETIDAVLAVFGAGDAASLDIPEDVRATLFAPLP